MPKKNNAGGCTCCACNPISERIDDFSSQWACWNGLPTGTGYVGLNNDWYFDTANGQLLRKDTGTFAQAQDPISADAILIPIPYSMEIVVDIDNYYATMLRLNMTTYHKNSAGTHFIGPYGNAALNTKSGTGGVNLYGQYFITDGSSFGRATWSEDVGPGTSSFKVQYRVQVDTDGMTHWMWYNDVLATTIPEPGLGTASLEWGTKWSRDLSIYTLNRTDRKSYWQMLGERVGTPASDIGKFDGIEVRIWNHVTNPRPGP